MVCRGCHSWKTWSALQSLWMWEDALPWSITIDFRWYLGLMTMQATLTSQCYSHQTILQAVAEVSWVLLGYNVNLMEAIVPRYFGVCHCWGNRRLRTIVHFTLSNSLHWSIPVLDSEIDVIGVLISRQKQRALSGHGGQSGCWVPQMWRCGVSC